MNDDLEKRLHNLRFAELPPDFMRRLQAAKPLTLGQRCRRWAASLTADHRRGWGVASAGLCAATILVLTAWQITAVLSPRRAATMNRVPSPQVTAVRILEGAPAVDHRQLASFDEDNFVYPDFVHLKPGAARKPSVDGGVALNVPGRQVFLACGGGLSGKEAKRLLLGDIDLAGGLPFGAGSGFTRPPSRPSFRPTN